MKLSQAAVGLFSSILLHSSLYFVGAENVQEGAVNNINIPLAEAHQRFTKIIDGTEVESSDEYPWFVSLTATIDTRPNPQPFCGGQLISPTYVLTAAHCVYDLPPPSGSGLIFPPQVFTVFVGAFAQPFRDDNNAEERKIKNIIPHPNWDGGLSIFGGWDFALLELDEESTKTPVKLDLDGVSDGFEGGEEVWAAGFGLTTPGGDQPDTLLEVELAHVTDEFCTGDIICANGPGDKNTCQGDSGGPLYSKVLGLLLGATSFGFGYEEDGVFFCDPTIPSGWARVSAAADWITENVNDLPPEGTVTPSLAPVVSVTPAPVVPVTPAPVVPVTPSPTTSTTDNCVDSTLRLKLTKDGERITRSCEWVANKATIMRCAMTGVAAACPVTCGTCNICQDPISFPEENPNGIRFRFEKNGSLITRSCVWVGTKDKINRCNLTGNICRQTCGMC